MNEMAIMATAAESVDLEVTNHLLAIVKETGVPVKILDVSLGRANPPDAILHQRVETAAQEQRINTEKQRKLAEDQRKMAEESRAAADQAYNQKMGLNTEQYVSLRAIEMQRLDDVFRDAVEMEPAIAMTHETAVARADPDRAVGRGAQQRGFAAADDRPRWRVATTDFCFGPGIEQVAGLAEQFVGHTRKTVGSIDLARDFTEMSSRLHISGEGAVLTMFRMGELMAYNEAEKAMYRLCAQDEARHVAFGVMHMRYMSETAPERREEIQCYLDEAERQILAGSQNPAGTQTDSSEALAILLGGGKDKYDEGVRKLIAIRRRQVQEYIKRVRSTGFGDRFDNGRSTLVSTFDHHAAA
jgi:hypothetical protein